MERIRYATDHIFSTLASAQFGAVSRPQLMTAGVAEHTIDRRLAAGVWRKIAPAILIAAPTKPTWSTRASAALLEAHDEAVLGGRTALAMFGLEMAIDLDAPPTLLVPHTKTHESPVAEVRQVKHWPSDEIVMVPGQNPVAGAQTFLATTPARSLVDLGVWTSPTRWDEFERILDAADRLGIASYKEVAESIANARALRRRGLRRISGAMSTRSGSFRVLDRSQLEVLAVRRFGRYGVISLVEFEVPHPAYPGSQRRADAICRRTRVIFEFDSRQWHLRDRQFSLDRARDARAAELGWTTIRLTWDDFMAHDAQTRVRVRRMCGLDDGMRPAA